MQPSIQFDTSAMDRMFKQLVAYSPVSVKATIRAEAGSILKTCASRTKVAKANNIALNARLFIVKQLGYAHGRSDLVSNGHIAINVGIRGDFGKVWQSVVKTSGPKKGTLGWQQTHGPNFKPLNRHFGQKRWTDLQEAVSDFKYEEKKRLPLAKRSAGLARQSWLLIGDDLGIRLEDVPGGSISAAGLAKARAALASDGRAYKNGTAREMGEARRFSITLTNQLPYGRRINLDRVLVSAIQGRVKFFERNVSLGVFQSLDKMLKAYPGVRVAYTGSPTRQN